MPNFRLRCDLVFEAEDELEALDRLITIITDMSQGTMPNLAEGSTISITKVLEVKELPAVAPALPSAKPAKAVFVPAGASYAPGVLGTSVPSSEELAKPDFEPNQDIL
jgi:hypothetical protein